MTAWRCRLRAPRAHTALPAAVVVGAATLLGACSETTVLNTRYSLASEPALGEDRVVVADDRARRDRAPLADLGATLRMDHDGATVPVTSPDGRFAAVQTATDAPWNVRLGDALPAAGVRSRIEAVSLAPETLGQPLATLTGPWLLGRAATDEAFLVERPRSDGGRDIALVAWADGTVRTIAEDGWTNAFATTAPDGSLAWCRRPAEGGDWELVVERAGARRVLARNPDEQWLYPIFAGDGTGLFALRLHGSALVVAWLPFEPGGLPSTDATSAPVHIMPLALGATLVNAAQIVQPVGGMAASSPGSTFVALYLPGLARAALWTPGGTLEPLTSRSVAATMLDTEAVLVTTPEMLGRQRLGDPLAQVDMLAEGPWLARPTTVSPTDVIVLQMRGGRVAIARLDVRRQTRVR